MKRTKQTRRICSTRPFIETYTDPPTLWNNKLSGVLESVIFSAPPVKGSRNQRTKHVSTDPRADVLQWTQGYAADTQLVSEGRVDRHDGHEPPAKRQRQLPHHNPRADPSLIPLAYMSIDFPCQTDSAVLASQLFPSLQISVTNNAIVSGQERLTCYARSASDPKIHTALELSFSGPDWSEWERRDLRVLLRCEDLTQKAARDHEPSTRSYCTITATRSGFRLEFSLLWHDGAQDRAFFKQLNPGALARHYRSPIPKPFNWSSRDFYESVHCPYPDQLPTATIDDTSLIVELYPFQKRTLQWMLQRELAIPEPTSFGGPMHAGPINPSFFRHLDAEGEPVYMNQNTHIFSRKPHRYMPDPPRGGILAEEMGLGKTCEIMALISRHRRPSDVGVMNIESDLTPTAATLIVTPVNLIHQWIDELTKHAPKLRWTRYLGMSLDALDAYDETEIIESFKEHDVVLTTYNILGREVHYAKGTPDRQLRRSTASAARTIPKCPLIKMHWWRLCIDEAQTVRDPTADHSQVAATIPRVNVWMVSGTPYTDRLAGLFAFLKYEPFASSTSLCNMLTAHWQPELKALINKIAIRHSKAQIRELILPPQNRHLVRIPFTAVEEQNFETMFEAMAVASGCHLDGSPAHGDWDPTDVELQQQMRSWLVRLRQTCLHPRVGGRNRRALGRTTEEARTLSEVLELMISQTELAIDVERRAVISTLITRAHVLGNAGDDDKRAMNALKVYESALERARDLVTERKKRAITTSGNSNADAAVSEEDTPEQSSHQPLRAALELQHACEFFVGTSCFQLKENSVVTELDSKDFKMLEEREMLHYDNAQAIRRELLGEAARRCEKLMESIAQMPDIDDSFVFKWEATQSVELNEDGFSLTRLMDSQRKLISTLRAKVIELLLKPLVDKDEAATTGEEYEESTRQQDVLYSYIDAYRALFDDYSTCLTGHVNPRIKHEMDILLKEARAGRGHAPELTVELLETRAAVAQDQPGAVILSLAGLQQVARRVLLNMTADDDHDTKVSYPADMNQHLIETAMAAQRKVLVSLERARELFRTTSNQRLEYYRQLQALSDTVAPYKDELDERLDVVALKEASGKLATQEKTLASLRTKRRFLVNLRNESDGENQQMCVICRSTTAEGILTVCGHRYCKECIQIWWRQNRSCPICKKHLSQADMHPITYKPRRAEPNGGAEDEAKVEDVFGHANHKITDAVTCASDETPSDAELHFRPIDADVLGAINAVTLPTKASFGSKTNTICRHLLHVRQTDVPGTKTVIFSQFRDYLDILSSALSSFGISHVSIYARKSSEKTHSGIERFVNDPSIECFLLDVKTNSSGLNLVVATNVVLCEPLVNAAIEAQAIARVHRIGQSRPTNVFLYAISGSVEENIVDLSEKNRRRLAVKTAGHEDDKAESRVLQLAALGSKTGTQAKEGGEVVPSADLWFCLFGRASRNAKS